MVKVGTVFKMPLIFGSVDVDHKQISVQNNCGEFKSKIRKES